MPPRERFDRSISPKSRVVDWIAKQVGTHRRRLRYTKSTGLWAIYWRDSNLKFHEYKRKRPTKNVEALRQQRRADLLELAAH